MYITPRLSMGLLAQSFHYPIGLLGSLACLGMNLLNRELNAQALELLDVRPGHRVLEIGFGSGACLYRMARIVGHLGKVVGIDPSPVCVGHAKWRCRKLLDERGIPTIVQYGRVFIHQDDVSSLSFQDGSFDRVVSVENVFLWPSIKENIRRVSRVVAEGGRLVISARASAAPLHESFGFDVVALLKEEGFTSVDIRALPMALSTALHLVGNKI